MHMLVDVTVSGNVHFLADAPVREKYFLTRKSETMQQRFYL
jgi:hypothetical protein